MSRRSVSPRSSAACAWSRRISRSSWRAPRATRTGTGQLHAGDQRQQPRQHAGHVLAHRLEQSRRHPAPRRAARALSLHRRLAGARALAGGRSGAERRAASAHRCSRVSSPSRSASSIPCRATGSTEWPVNAVTGPVSPANIDELLTDAAARHRVHGGVRGLGPHATPVRDPDVKHARQRGVALLVAIMMFAIATTRRGRHHLQQGDGRAARRRHVHAGAGAAGGHGRRSAGRHRARETTASNAKTDARAGLGRSRSARWKSKAPGMWIQAQIEDLTGAFQSQQRGEVATQPPTSFVADPDQVQVFQQSAEHARHRPALRGSAGRLDRHRTSRPSRRRAARTRCT